MKLETKLKLFYGYTDFNFIQDMGSSLLSRFRAYAPPIGMILTSTGALVIIADKIAQGVDLFGMHIQFQIPVFWITALLFAKFYFWIVMNYFVGRRAKRVGLLEAQNNYLSKTKEYAPFNTQLQNTLKEICKKLDIKDHFTEL